MALVLKKPLHLGLLYKEVNKELIFPFCYTVLEEELLSLA